MSTLHFSGHEHLSLRLALALIAGRPTRIDKIRPEDTNPGLRDYEISYLRLLERLSNGSVIEISVTGTALTFKPGVIVGGNVTHTCPLSKSVGYFLEAVILFAPFSKNPLNLTLHGITTDEHDLSVDVIRTVTLPHMQLFGISDGLELKIKKRGASPEGGGEVQLLCPVVKTLTTLNFVSAGKIKRIRGISHAVRVNPTISKRMIEASREILNQYIPDIYLFSDVYKGDESGKSPGYALTLTAESTTSVIVSSESVSKAGTTPEEVAINATEQLLQEIVLGGCIDRRHQRLVLLYMTLGSEDIGRCEMAAPSADVIQFLRDLKDFFRVTFRVTKPEEPSSEQTYMLSAFGNGYVNVNRSIA